MPLRESEAVVLRSFPLGEADRVVSFLSRAMGKMRGVARGACRPKSKFGAALEPLSYIRIWFYERETRELVRISQCELLESFLEAQRDYTCALGLALVSEVTEAVLPDREPSDAAFRLVLVAARAIQRTGKIALPASYFLLWTVRLAGWLPELHRCARCGRELGTAGAYAAAAPTGLACAKCKLPGMRALAPRSLAAARQMLEERLDRLTEDKEFALPGRELDEWLLDVIEHQIERKLNTRRMLESAQ
jgi:DNA repair protein RecO (recombination protein O)